VVTVVLPTKRKAGMAPAFPLPFLPSIEYHFFMKIAILGGGFTGLIAAYYLKQDGHEVTIFERENVLGGLASGFKADGWDWYLERAYHHIFSNDEDILSLAEELDFKDFFLATPQTASLYETAEDVYKIFPLDSPVELLKFPLLSPFERLRAGIVLAFMKFLPFFSFYEKEPAASFLQKTMGGHAYGVLFGELFRKKFGKYAENILATFFWARINKRTPKLGYINGGFQTFLNYIEERCLAEGVKIEKGTAVESMKKIENEFVISHAKKDESPEQSTYDRVISTLPTPVVTKVAKDILPQEYIDQFSRLKYLNAACLIVESDTKLLDEAYWLSVCVKKFPMMVLLQHTNMVSPEQYGGKHILYIANYIEKDHELLSMEGEQALEYYKPYLDMLNPVFAQSITRTFYFRAPFAQPIFDKDFLDAKPDFKTPAEGFFIANLDMTYPYDRGTNYAVKLGREVTKFIK
jgi:protoporphyrinogen oxidase